MLVIMRLGLPLMVWPSIVLIMLKYPQQFLPYCVHSQVLWPFDHGNAHADHAATAVQLEWTDSRMYTGIRPGATQHDIEHKLPKTLQASAFACYPRCNGSINHGLHSGLHNACPHTIQQPENLFITAETWALRTEKLQLHKRLLQGLFGVPSAKPTTLLVTSRLPQGASIGKDESGKFKTSPLKAYPPGFCRAIAQAFLHDICTEPVRSAACYHRHFWSDVHRCMLVPLAISLAKTDCQTF